MWRDTWNVWRWAAASNERAAANARGAALACSRLRLERAEVEQFLALHTAAYADAQHIGESWTRTGVRVSSAAR